MQMIVSSTEFQYINAISSPLYVLCLIHDKELISSVIEICGGGYGKFPVCR